MKELHVDKFHWYRSQRSRIPGEQIVLSMDDGWVSMGDVTAKDVMRILGKGTIAVLEMNFLSHFLRIEMKTSPKQQVSCTGAFGSHVSEMCNRLSFVHMHGVIVPTNLLYHILEHTNCCDRTLVLQ